MPNPPMQSTGKWIPLDQCKDGWLYAIHARNARLGIFSAVEKGFIISRMKFTENYLFTEYHWDTGAPFGTVMPERVIEEAPKFANDNEKLEWLNKKEDEIPDDRTMPAHEWMYEEIDKEYTDDERKRRQETHQKIMDYFKKIQESHNK